VRDEWGDWQEPASYAWGKWLNQKMEEAERKRLLYVACTRAADRLFLTGQLSKGGSWLQEIITAFDIDPQGPEEELCVCASFGMRVFRPNAPEDSPSLDKPALQNAQGVKVVPPLARPLPAQPLHQPLAASRLGRLRRFDQDDRIDLRPAILPDKGSDAGHRAPGYLIGEMVHRALAHWQCLSYPQHALIQYLENLARRSGVDPQALEHAVRTSYTILGRLKRHHVFADVRAAVDTYREIPFTLKTQQGTIQGVIDLLYQDAQGGWHVLDWKTEWTPEEEIEERAQEHRLQMAVYARAVQRQLGVEPRIELCFLSPRVRLYEVDRLANGGELDGIF
jgi:ATP-dependent helicase/nuclease subunit A